VLWAYGLEIGLSVLLRLDGELGLLKQQQQTPCISLPQPAARERAPILADRSARSSGA
jgi:hypothetical protein